MLIFVELSSINFSNIFAKQFEIEIGLMLFISSEHLFESFKIGLMIDVLKFAGIV